MDLDNITITYYIVSNYLLDLLHNMIRYSDIQAYRKRVFRNLRDWTIKQAQKDGLLAGTTVDTLSENDRSRFSNLVLQTLREMEDNKEIHHSRYASYKYSPEYDIIQWSSAKNLVINDTIVILAAAARTSQLHASDGLTVFVDYDYLTNYETYLGRLQQFFSRSRNRSIQNTADYLTNVNYLIAERLFKVNCFGIRLTYLGRSDLSKMIDEKPDGNIDTD